MGWKAKNQFAEKLQELKTAGDPVAFRVNEDRVREQWIQALTGTIKNYCSAASQPGEKYNHIAADKLAKIVDMCSEMQKWLDDMQAKQAAIREKTVTPVLL